jgi:hypothetical protein
LPLDYNRNGVVESNERMKTRLTIASFGLASAAATFLLVWPVYSGFNGRNTTHAPLLQVNGSWAILPVLFPVFLAFLPVVAFRKQVLRITAAVVMLAFSFISGFTIGLFYVPAAIAMLLAACVADSAKFRDALW